MGRDGKLKMQLLTIVSVILCYNSHSSSIPPYTDLLSLAVQLSEKDKLPPQKTVDAGPFNSVLYSISTQYSGCISNILV